MAHERRIFINLPASQGSGLPLEIDLTAEQRHHLVKVLRLEEGSAVVAVSNQDGGEYDAILTDTRSEARIKIITRRNTYSRVPRSGSIIFALSKGDKNDFVCEKACELGVERVIFWQSRRSIVKLGDEKEIQKKLGRWKAIAQSAAEQSCRNSIPAVLFASNVENMLKIAKENTKPGDLSLCCSLSPEATEIRHLPAPAGRVHILIGPEGDFTPEEESAARSSGFELASLGRLVLRSETAALCALSMVNGVWGDPE